ncbi:MAG: cytochrome P450 [Deltaproteobacteria bacterium]|nr:cytochrome P450 [Deltaproteobacteria bacterium]
MGELMAGVALPLDLSSSEFHQRKYEWYPQLLESHPVCTGKVSLMKVSLVSRYDDCRLVLADSRFVRNRGLARGRGSSPFPVPLPKSVAALATGMIIRDDPEHRRLRSLVNQGFTGRAISKLRSRIEEIVQERLLQLRRQQGPVDLLESYALPIPRQVIAEMVGVTDEEGAQFTRAVRTLTQGLSGLGLVKTLLWDMRQTHRFIRDLVEKKRLHPSEDILSELLVAEEDGDRLSEDELHSMVFLLVVAGFETTLHLIGNAVHTLIENPNSISRLQAEPTLWSSAIQEVVRFRGPIHGTKFQYPTEDVTVEGVVLRRGKPVMPLLGAANLDPRVFNQPDVFQIDRTPNHHLGFGFGEHFCLGRQLALAEAETAVKALFAEFPNLHLAVKPSELEHSRMPGWHRLERLPIHLS